MMSCTGKPEREATEMRRRRIHGKRREIPVEKSTDQGQNRK
jgi:hypothetical protein